MISYLIADYERRNFSISQCSWDPEAQEKIIAIESPTSSETNEKPKAGTNTKAWNSGLVAEVTVGSVFGLLFIIFLGYVGRRKLITIFGLAAKNTLHYDENETQHTNVFEVDCATSEEYEIDGRMYPGVELEADRAVQEMKSNEEVEVELAESNLHLSELPS